MFLSPTFSYPLSLGKITRIPRFEFETAYDGPLGFEYHPEYTVFRIWAPVAKEVVLVLVHGDTTQDHMKYVGRGVWELKVTGDLDRWGYYYLIRVNQVLEPVLDPYGLSASPNFTMNFVIDWEKTYPMQNERPPFSGRYVDAIIYEMHLRDFSLTRFQTYPTSDAVSIWRPSNQAAGIEPGIQPFATLGDSPAAFADFRVWRSRRNRQTGYNRVTTQLQYPVELVCG